MVCKFTKVVFVVLSGVGLASAQTFPLLRGQVGTPHVGRPELVGKGNAVVTVGAVYTDFGRNTNDPRGETGDYGVSATIGLAEKLDVALFLQYAAVNAGSEGLSRAGLGLKSPLFAWESVAVALAAQLMPSLESSDRLVSSGQTNYQVHVLVGYDKSKYRLSVELGFGKMDFASERDIHLSAEPTVTGAVSLFLDITPRAGFFAELVGARVTSKGDDDLFVHVGSVLRLSGGLELLGGAGVGLPNKTVANTDLRATLGLRYARPKS